jgi:hypothetical protein
VGVSDVNSPQSQRDTERIRGKGPRSYDTVDDLKVNLSAYLDKPPAI